MGPNGSGKSTLAYSIAGHPKYTSPQGTVTLDGEDVLAMTVDERARAGLFLAMQYPVEVPGVSVSNFLRTAATAVRGEAPKLRHLGQGRQRRRWSGSQIDPAFAERSVNEGFSGGEKKRHEILQLALLKPKIAILDETDSGLDVDALRVVVRGRQPGPREPGDAASCSSRTTPASCATSSPTSCTSSSTAASSTRAARSWPTGSRPRATTSTSKARRRHDATSARRGADDRRYDVDAASARTSRS